MNSDEIKGKLKNLAGRAKQAAGSLTGNHRTEAEGAVERVAGAAQERVGEVEEELSAEEKAARVRARQEDDEEI